MSPERRRLALRASSAALRVRHNARIASDQPCNVFDLAEELGLEVRFAALPSAEGIYSPGKPVIVVSSLRPAGRQAFTCAHELGHHVFGHGERFDELVERGKIRRFDPKEFEADCFAAALLMPKTALLKNLAARGWNARTLSPEQCYRLSSWLGVGYTTLVGNMNWGMGLIDDDHAMALEKTKPPQIRKAIVGRECKDQLVVVDETWTGRAIDARVDDLILLPPASIIEGPSIEPVSSDAAGCLVRAAHPGVGRALVPASGWAQYVRISRNPFVGLSRFRHLEEVDDE